MNKFIKLSVIVLSTVTLAGCGSSDKDSMPANEIVPHNYITYNGITYGEITSPITQKIWLDRNLGASNACFSADYEECFGDYYQWGRQADGHQRSDSNTTTNKLNSVLDYQNNQFVISDNSDWTTVDNDGALRVYIWNKIDGTSICPIGFRVPSHDEIQAEGVELINSDTFTYGDRFYETFLKLPYAGVRDDVNGSIHGKGKFGFYWTNSIASIYSGGLNVRVLESFGYEESSNPGNGFSVRCIKD